MHESARTRSMTARVACVAAAAILASGTCVVPALAAGGFTADPSVAKLSGMSADPDNGQFWAVQPTSKKVSALDEKGALNGAVTLDISPVDVQAVSYRNGRVFVGDIGDVKQSRDNVLVYRFGDLALGATAAHRSYTLAYPDGAHDSGAMAVSAKGRIYLVTRGSSPAIYRSQLELTSGGAVNTLTRAGDAPANVTDATFSQDGAKLLLRTLTGVHVLDAYELEEVAAAALPASAQGLAMANSLSGSGVLVSGQGSPVPVSTVALPTSLASLPPAPASLAAPTTPATPSATPSAKAASTPGAASQNRGTLWALAAAGAISLLSGAYVALKR